MLCNLGDMKSRFEAYICVSQCYTLVIKTRYKVIYIYIYIYIYI